MAPRARANKSRSGERGSTLFIVAGSLIVLLGVGALAIDIASLYVARNESQRAADSAALAGAKVFVESGCVTTGDCTSEEATATARATQVAAQNLVAGQAVTVSAITFKETRQNPQITVQVKSADLRIFFAGAIGIKTAPAVGATATAEAYNPSGEGKGLGFCTGCVRPWLIPNCDVSHAGPATNSNCPDRRVTEGRGAPVPPYAYFLDPSRSDGVENPGCYPTGVIGEPLEIAVETQPKLFGTVDDGAGLTGYQQSITMCNTGQMTCGMTVNTLIGSKITSTVPGVGSLLHVPGGNTGPGQGQDWIDTTPPTCPPQIHAGWRNPLVKAGIVAQDAPVTTSDSIVTAYLFDGSPLNLNVTQPVKIVGFIQIFVTQQNANGDVSGVILGLAGCARDEDECASGSIRGSTMLPVRLITPAITRAGG